MRSPWRELEQLSVTVGACTVHAGDVGSALGDVIRREGDVEGSGRTQAYKKFELSWVELS
jgi:hypothetical protein